MRFLTRAFIALTLGILMGLIANAVQGAERTEVDVELVLAVDVSLSMDEKSFRLEMQGYADAFRDPRVHRAITNGALGQIAVTLMQWSGYGTNDVSLSWRLLDGAESALAFADELQAVTRMSGGSTSISGAIDFGSLQFGTAHDGLRRVIDISGDGKNNNGRDPESARDEAVAKGITINGIPISAGEDGLEAHYRDSVIGGVGAFLIVANGFEDFGQAITRKLIQEIASTTDARRDG